MEPEILIETSQENTYLGSLQEKIFVPITPIFRHIINEIKKVGDKNYVIPEKVTIGKEEYNKPVIQYYYNKYKYLKINGLLSKKALINQNTARISPDEIRRQIANLNQLVFEVTDACNLKCKYCAFGDFYFDYDKRENSYLSFSKAKGIIDFLISQWQSPLNQSINEQTFVSFYGGEPLLNIKLIKSIIEYIENKNIPNKRFKWNMTSNGVLLDKYMDYLVKKEFILVISLDGNEYNQGYRVNHNGINSFPQIQRNLHQLKLKYPKYFKSNVFFNAVLHNRNSVQEIVSFIKDSFDKIPTISELSSSGIRPDLKDEYFRTYRNLFESLHQTENYDDLISEMKWNHPENRSLSLFIHRYSGNVYRKYNDLLDSKKKSNYFPTGTCFPFNKKLFVSVNGKILPCERIGHQYALGQITTQNEPELDYHKIAEKYNRYFDKLKKHCFSCYRAHSCIECIFQIESIDKLKTRCQGYTNLERIGKFLSNQISYLENHPELYKQIMKELIIK